MLSSTTQILQQMNEKFKLISKQYPFLKQTKQQIEIIPLLIL